MDVLGTDPTLNPGQRSALKLIYKRFAPRVERDASVKVDPELTVREVLPGDPNLNRGQVETILTVLDTFKNKRKG